jgi:periplasmic protein TonB
LRRGYSGLITFTLALMVSIAAHVSLAAWWLYSRSGELGSVDVPTRAISVNLEATDIVDAPESTEARQATSSPAGEQSLLSAAKQTNNERDDKILPSLEPEMAKPQDKIGRQAAESAEEKRQVPDEAEAIRLAQHEAEREETLRRAEANERERKRRERERQAAFAGDAGITGSRDAEASAGHVSASQGSILNYGARLRTIISANVPRDVRGKSLRVMFKIAPGGGLASIKVIESSHDEGVDRKIVDLVRRLSTEFPPPPQGATATQLSYNIEIIFR